jgi:DNA-binding IclR family transcriptional regulator
VIALHTSARRVLYALSRAEPGEGITLEQVQERTGLLARTALRMLEDLRRAGLVNRHQIGVGNNPEVRWALTTIGRSYSRESIPPR